MKKITVVEKFIKHAGYADLCDLWNEIKDPKLAEFFENLRALYSEGKYDEYKQKKESLNAFIITGMYSSARSASSLIEYSGMVVLDIDKLGCNLPNVRKAIVEDRHTLACFLSPSGDGLKVIVRVDSSVEDHKDMFHAVSDYFKTVANTEVDSTGSNICRLCFISYDPDLYVNEGCEQFRLCAMVKRVRQMELFLYN